MVFNDQKRYDVVIAGSGPAGIAAALAAAGNGASTLLIERAGFVGGMSTGGLLNIWCGYASSGIFRTVYELTTKKRGRRHVYNPESLKHVYLDMLENAGVDLLLHSMVVGADMEGSVIRSVKTVHKGGYTDIAGSVFIDSTGDGDLAALCGVPFSLGRENDHKMQPATVMMMLGGVDESCAVYPTFGTHPQYEKLMQQTVSDGLISKPAGHVICIEGYHPGTAGVNMTNVISVDGTDPVSLTEAEIHARMQVPAIVTFLREYVPGYRDCYLMSTGAWIGIRETRHFTGDFTLDEHHIQNNTVFKDWIVTEADYGFGNHNLDGSGSDRHNKPYNHKGYTIPYGCFIPVGVENLLLNGRCISGTHMAHASYRVMPICMAMGQGVGTAAALSIERGGRIRQVDIRALQDCLLRQGVASPEQINRAAQAN